MHNLLSIALITVTAALVGCGVPATPPKSMAEKVVRAEAEKELLDGMSIVDFQHDNGWSDQNSQNRYIVRYKYKVRLDRGFADIALDVAKQFEQEYKTADAKTGMLGKLELMNTNMGITIRAKQVLDTPGAKERYNALLNSSKSAKEYIDGTQKDEDRNLRVNSYLAAWHYLMTDLNFGLRDGQVAGTELERTYWVAFMKTENGWQQAN